MDDVYAAQEALTARIERLDELAERNDAADRTSCRDRRGNLGNGKRTGMNRMGWLFAASRHIRDSEPGLAGKWPSPALTTPPALSALAIGVWLSLFLLSAPFAGFCAVAAVRAVGSSNFGARTAGATAAAIICAFCLAASAVTLLPAAGSHPAASPPPGSPARWPSGSRESWTGYALRCAASRR
jgi:hypothetical protein